MTNSQLQVEVFQSLEEQTEYFATSTNTFIPSMTVGAKYFFREIGSWLAHYSDSSSEMHDCLIMPDPTHGLSFSTPRDVLSTALNCMASSANSPHSVVGLLHLFGLTEKLSTQPLISLSSGEIMLLNFAKATALMPVSSGIHACSPTRCLNQVRYQYWDFVVSQFLSNGRTAQTAILDGEQFHEKTKYNLEKQPSSEIPDIRFLLRFNSLCAIFDEVEFPTPHPHSHIEYVVPRSEFNNLSSPTLLTGDNGIGKTVLAKILSGLHRNYSGSFSIQSVSGSGRARFIFSDTVDQLFGKSIADHIDWVFRYQDDKKTLAIDIYDRIDRNMRDYVARNHASELFSALGSQERPNSILQGKIALIAERIASKPSLLILDEPERGLTLQIARILIETACREAATHFIPVMIVTHLPLWWEGIARTRLSISALTGDTVSLEQVEFK